MTVLKADSGCADHQQSLQTPVVCAIHVLRMTRCHHRIRAVEYDDETYKGARLFLLAGHVAAASAAQTITHLATYDAATIGSCSDLQHKLALWCPARLLTT